MRKQVAQKKQRRKDRRSRIEQLENCELLARDAAGIISEDETWSGTIRVTNNVTIAADVTVDVEPGTVIKFANGQWLTALGTFDAIGTGANPIIFTTTQDDTVGGDSNANGDATSPVPNVQQMLA